ncbi:efflux RND transporter periplasmic adaptor subunit [Hymenobacter ginsengisoli]|uniref:Efflux RND transporter periplasmic adaptor subunit n=1 Tax=Hymenobacter ginsengisoli TaxID=1051626 RepID=A0ABP8Q5A2_9BACT|nr:MULTISPECIES: efflux RND transporter periplasmic adaptor subunit [unclassified Hymenobacter]MBO2031777.1 efflux RND transporter periplasmic adaptor subunit [Hymenobacter sp. BT559]
MNRAAYFLLLTLGLGACSKASSSETATAAEETKTTKKFSLSDQTLKELAFDSVRLEPVRSEQSFSGQVTTNGDKTAKVFPLVGGVVEKLNVELGDHVTKGQVLAVVRSGEIADVQNQNSTAGTDVAIAQKNLSVAEDQFKAGLAAERDVVLAREELRKAQSNLGKTNKQLGIYGVSKDGRYTIKAPISGFITEKNVTQNMQYNDSNVDSFFTIADLDQVWVLANVFEADIANVKLGYEADITTLSYPDKHFHGVVDKVFNVLDPDSKALKVRIRLTNPGYLLKPEMYAQVHILNTEKQKELAVPANSVVFDKDQHFVLVYKSRTEVDTRSVKVLKTVGDVSYVSGNLKAGDVIVTKNQLLVYDELND